MTAPTDEEVIERFRVMTEQFPDNVLPWFSHGKALLEAGRLQEAIPSLEKVLQLDPQHGMGALLLGTALSELGRYDRAKEVWTAGYEHARTAGEILPARKMAARLRKLADHLCEDPPELTPLPFQSNVIGLE